MPSHRLDTAPLRRRMKKSAAATLTLADAPQMAPAESGPIATWPRRPDPSVLNKSIPLFFISRDHDGFWIACEAEFRIGGIFICQRSALNFAKRCSEPRGCASIILSDVHNLDIENRGNRFVAQLRPAKRLVRRLSSKLNAFFRTVIAKARAIGARMSRAYIEDRMLRAAYKAEIYRGRCRHSNNNDDDLPIVRQAKRRKLARTNEQSIAGGIRGAQPAIIAFLIFILIIAGIIALRVAIWLPAFHH
jgi:hypothetical protein